MVNFDEPVTIQEIRVIPLGAKIEIKPGGLRLGATNPAKFHLEGYAVDLKNKKSSTFVKIGRSVFMQWAKQSAVSTGLRRAYSLVFLVYTFIVCLIS